MKKNLNTLKSLKALVNEEGATLRLRLYGVQAYNIEAGNEHNVITEFARINGRYYFIDRDGKKFLASRYDRAEELAAEFDEQLDRDAATAQELASKARKHGAVWVRGCLLDIFFDSCDADGLEVESKQAAVTESGEIVTLYVVKADNNATDTEAPKFDAKAEVLACVACFIAYGNVSISNDLRTDFEDKLNALSLAYEITDGDDYITRYDRANDGTDKTAEQVADTLAAATDATATDTTEATASVTACEPSRFALAFALGWAKAKDWGKRAAFAVCLACVAVLGLLTMYGVMCALYPIFEALELGSIACIVASVAALFTIVLDSIYFVVNNSLAILCKIFPEYFCENHPGFIFPCSLIYHTIKATF